MEYLVEPMDVTPNLGCEVKPGNCEPTMTCPVNCGDLCTLKYCGGGGRQVEFNLHTPEK